MNVASLRIYHNSTSIFSRKNSNSEVIQKARSTGVKMVAMVFIYKVWIYLQGEMHRKDNQEIYD